MKNKNGFSIIEILIAIGMIAFVITSIVGVLTVTREASLIGWAKLKGMYYVMDYIEKARNIRRDDWDALANGKYIVAQNSGVLSFQTTTVGETVNGYTRFLEIGDVYRDSDGNLLSAPGLTDPSSKKITITVSWEGLKPGQLTHSVLLTRYLDSLSITDTTVVQFEAAGEQPGIAVVATDGFGDGEVVLGAGGEGNWCDPSLTLARVDLPKNGVAQAVTAIQGLVFAGTGENASGESFAKVEIPEDPADSCIVGLANGYKTNDVFGSSDGTNDYGYIATDTNSKEIVILNITGGTCTSQGTYTEMGYFNAEGVVDATSVYVYGAVGYMTQGNKLRAFDLFTKSGERPHLASATLSGTGNAVVVSYEPPNYYAYVATDGPNKLEIYDVSSLYDENPSTNTIELKAWAQPDTTQGAKDVVVNETGTRAYIVTSESSSKNEFFVIDTQYKTGILDDNMPSYDSSPMSPKAVEVVPGGKAIIVGTGGTEYQVIQSLESIPIKCIPGELNIDSGIFDSASLLVVGPENHAYSYIVTGDASAELKIIEGGPGGAFATSGTYESRTFDSGFNSTGYIRFEVNYNEPPQTSIQFYVSAKDPGGDGTCNGILFNDIDYVGPFSDGAIIPTDNDGNGFENPAQCFRYRAYLQTSEAANSPALYDFTFLYSP